MQRKKMSIISVSEQHSRICCIKYSLMACNAFGIMLGIFVVLFGISYPKEDFPGGYSGKTTAGISGVFIFFTGIGYCGAHHQKTYFLLFYAAVILLFLAGNLAVAFWLPDRILLDPYGKPFYVVSSLLLLVMILAILLAWQLCTQRKKGRRNRRRSSTTRASSGNSNTPSNNNNNNAACMNNNNANSCNNASTSNLINSQSRTPNLAAHFGQAQQQLQQQQQQQQQQLHQQQQQQQQCNQPDNEHGFGVNGQNVLVKANLHPSLNPNNPYMGMAQAPLHRYTNNNNNAFSPFNPSDSLPPPIPIPPQ